MIFRSLSGGQGLAGRVGGVRPCGSRVPGGAGGTAGGTFSCCCRFLRTSVQLGRRGSGLGHFLGVNGQRFVENPKASELAPGLCLNPLSLQKPPREEEEEALAVTDQVQG